MKEDRAALCVPKPGPGGEGQLSPDTGTLAGPRGKGPKPGEPTPNPSREKATLLYELVTVRVRAVSPHASHFNSFTLTLKRLCTDIHTRGGGEFGT